MFAVVQTIFGFAFAIAWIGGAAILAFRWWAKLCRYLDRFSPVDGFPRDAPPDRFMGMTPFGMEADARRQASQQQSDPELERLRQEVSRSYGAVALWGIGMPIVVFGAILLLTIARVLP